MRRTASGAGILTPADRVLAAARQLHADRAVEMSVAQLLARVHTGGAALSQRSVYNGLRDLLAGDTARWGWYALM